MDATETEKYWAELGRLNPCVKFVVDNYDVLCIAHPGETVLVVGQMVVRTFPSMIDGMMYTRAVDMIDVPYVLKSCDGSDVYDELTISTACKIPN